MLIAARLRSVNKYRSEVEWQHPIDAWTLRQWWLAVFGEIGEVFNAIKKLKRGDGSIEAVGQEIADAIIYMDLACARASMHKLPFNDYPSNQLLDSEDEDYCLNIEVLCGRISSSLLSKNKVFDADIEHLLFFLICLSNFYDLDVSEQIIKTFNKKSEQKGFKSRLDDTFKVPDIA